MNYENSGVNINKGNQFVETIQEICGNKIIGGFGGIYEQNGLRLVAATDGVGTKLELCRRMNKYDTIGIDLVAMCVNDILCQGGRPLFFLDYYAVGELNLEIAEQIIKGIQEGCKQSNCILLGGETAEMPLVYEKGKFDLAGFSVGVIDNDIYPKKINEGDYIFGLPSTGVHSNGYSLIHKLLEKEKYNIDELMKPTKIYVNEIEKIKTELNGSIKGFAHITGGGIPENLPRCLPEGLKVNIDWNAWSVPEIFLEIQRQGNMDEDEMKRVFNLGIGYCVIVPSNSAEFAMDVIRDDTLADCWQIGEIMLE